MIDTNKIREDVGGPRARDPDNETIHALCDEVDALNLVNSERSQALVDAAAALGYPTLAISNETAVLVAKKASKDLADACAERDQLRAEMAEARKTVDALGRQVAALRDALLGVRRALSDWSAPAADAVLRDTATVASGFYSEAEAKSLAEACIDLWVETHGEAPIITHWSQSVDRLKKARSA